MFTSDLNMSIAGVPKGDMIIAAWAKDRLESDKHTDFFTMAGNVYMKDRQELVTEFWKVVGPRKYISTVTPNLLSVMISDDMVVQITYQGNKNYFITVYGNIEHENAIRNRFYVTPPKDNPTASWYFTDDQKRWHDYDLEIQKNGVDVIDEMYPFIEGGVQKFIEGYMKSSATVVLMAGPPGTGKTSLLRHFLHYHHIDCRLTYDENIMTQDQFFLSFFMGGENCLVIEDADVLLASRKNSANKIMSKFLNVSDGIVKMPDKKMIFTTNLENLDNVDKALLRPGRCYKTLVFRELSETEMKKLCKKLGRKPLNLKKDSYSLAEIFASE